MTYQNIPWHLNISEGMDVHCALCRDVQLAEETSYGVQTVLAHATTLEDDDNDDDDDDDGPHLTTLNIRVQN